MKLLGLRIDVDMARGLQVGVPRLMGLLGRLGVSATFFVPMGPDNSGRAIRRAVEARGFVTRMRRLRVVRRYGVSSLLRGVLVPATPFSRMGDRLRSLEAAGHEVGMHGYDHFLWQDTVLRAARATVERWLRDGAASYTRSLGHPPALSAAPGWLCTEASLEVQDSLQLHLASDVRGRGPFMPVAGGATLRTPQLPTTLPCLEELLVEPGLNSSDAVQYLCGATRQDGFLLYTGHAELEGVSLLDSFSQLLELWLDNGILPVPLGRLRGDLDPSTLPRCEVSLGTVPGRSLPVSVQGSPVHTGTERRYSGAGHQ
jgi:peptidoglycan/xylan/chitin deacetylase (PgdA/CDA1 family)